MDPRLTRPGQGVNREEEMSEEEPRCASCGMPMPSPELHAAGDFERSYCLYCARTDGSMKSYEEVEEGMTHVLIQDRGLDDDTAREVAAEIMAALPAWSDSRSSR